MTRSRCLLLPALPLALPLVSATSLALGADAPLRLWYEKPAAAWVEALPIGNGRLGAMVFGDPRHERLALNEDTLWSGGPTSWNNPDAKAWLPKVREAVFAGRYAEANELAKKMQGPYNQSYLPLGDLLVDFDVAGEIEGYRRELDLDRAVATTSFRAGGATHTREAFASFPDQVIVLRVGADRPGQVSFTARLTSRLRHTTAAEGYDAVALRGRAPSHVDPSYLGDTKDAVRYDEGPSAEGMRFTAIVRAVVRGGETRATPEGRLEVRGADEAVVIVAAATSFDGFDRSPGREGADPDARARRTLAAASAKPFAALRDAHVADHARLFGRVRLDLGAPAADRPTDERLRAYRHGEDPALVALVFQYGRYLLVASSRPGTQPANLQGLWNEDVRPPWSSNWTMNINSEMNYWPAEATNLSECHEPMLRMIAELARNGRETARVNYGARGWVAHHNADLWRQTAPVGNWGQGDPKWANWPMGAVWHSMDLWERYAFTRDEAWLRDFAWPLLRGASEFALDWLVPDGKGGLATAPSFSPENTFRVPDGAESGTGLSTTSDLALLRELFTNAIEASTILDVDVELRREMEQALLEDPALPGRPPRPAPRVERGVRGAGAAPPAHVPPHRPPSRAQHHSRRDSRPRRGRAALAGAARRRQHGLVDGLEGEPVGPPRRRGPRAPAHRLPAPPRRDDGHELRGRGRRLRQPLRRAPAVPDRRQLRRDRRHRGDARAVAPPRRRRSGARRRPPPRPALRLADGPGGRPPRPRGVRGGPRVGGRPAEGRHPALGSRRTVRRAVRRADGGPADEGRRDGPPRRRPFA